MNKQEIVEKIISNCAVAVIRLEDSGKLIKVVEAIHSGGVSSIEITMTVPNAIEMIKKVCNEFGDSVMVGVGSVLNANMAQEAIDAGAKYVVSPILKEEIIKKARENNIAVMPGCFTPTEINLAYELGADIIKVFPADVLGINFFKGVKAPMPHLKMMPTGGVNLINPSDWLRAGACAVGVGSALIDKKAINENNYTLLRSNAEILMNGIKEYFSNK
ncbi:MAG: bifunctional 4-hydroxy-2-oxoglutarate aldolase/2-dehydro-3-deoxy-phosphogluconate aldolase [Melioribacteraceae bacterium]